MRIAYFINQYPAVSHSFIRREILALETLGLEVHRFAIRMERSGVVDDADLKEAEATRHIVKTLPRELVSILLRQVFFNPARSVRALLFAMRFAARSDRKPGKALLCLMEACVLSDWARRQGIRHIHAHFGTNSTTVAMLASALGGPGYSFTAHGPEEFDKAESIGLREKIGHARFVVAVSSYGRAQLYRWADFDDWKKIHIIHCGLDASFLNVPITPVPDQVRIICVGRLSEQKGQIMLIQAVSRLVAEGLSLNLVLVGNGPLRGEIERLIAENGLSAHVELTGSLSGEQIRGRIADSRIFVLPSFAEGLPVVIMEAFALGRPVISTYVAGIPELVSDGVNGWLVPAGAVEELVSAVRLALMATPRELSEMGSAGRQQVLEHYAIDAQARKLSELFLKAIETADTP
ncbi:glycosyltransferase family 4 protein [Methylococcus sp. EFPC2]|uniref:glycosyltransferase family 4 protein n=1 Tax=Methylococcus sp. EFPC2 TaxID=2812648 RepID=UPI0019681128|nr:glycosyltransferase family 4 protein [Methylococcus sp. EFPC2]QSA97296.1 glycosyltransferase family 4 protein [Methylococcus sp. EFPC2]